MSTKPVLLLIRYPLVAGEREEMWPEAVYIRALRNFFDLTIIEYDCDFDAVCAHYKPDLVAFRGSFCAPHRRIQIHNTYTHAHIPRVGLYFGDGFCSSRLPFFRDMERWGVTDIFAHTFYLQEHTPDAAQRIYVVPQAVDESLYHDYDEPKVIPFSISGGLSDWRRWRTNTTFGLIQRYPTMVIPHPGYGAAPNAAISYMGESYARLLNRSRFSICDGSLFNCILRRHIEIPACGAILVSQPLPWLAEYGFADMENCVIGEGDELYDKLNAILSDPARERAIARAGYELVQSRHTSRHTDQLYRWFLLRRQLQPGDSIVQHGSFGAFEITRDGRRGAIPPCQAPLNELEASIRQGELDLKAGNFDACFERIRLVLEIKPEFAPARLLHARALLMAGRLKEAAAAALFIFKFARGHYAAEEPDPVEWAWWVVILFCSGMEEEAMGALAEYPGMRHLELRRVVWLVKTLRGQSLPQPEGRRADDRPSVATSIEPDFTVWATDIAAMLRRLGRLDFAQRIAAAL